MITLYRLATRLPRWFYLTLAAILYLLMLGLGMIQHTVDNLPGREHWSKLYHLVFYFGMACMLWFGVRKPQVLHITLMVMVGGMIDEIHQYFFPFREARVTDVMIDTAAALLGALLMAWLKRRSLKAAWLERQRSSKTTQ